MRSIHSTSLAICAAALLLAGCAAQKPKSDDSKSQSQTQKDSGSKAPASAASGQQARPAPAPEPSGSSAMPETTRTASASSEGSAGARAQTPEERRAALDKRLEGSLGTFDDTLRREQKTVAEEKDANDAAASSDSDSSDSKSSDESGSAKPEGLPAEASEPGRSRGETPTRPGDLKSDKDREANDPNKPGGGSGASGDKIPDGSDDDIVAKRLRKAAEQETDPELKEKLWKEYIEYKKNAGK
jgi:hypothetical protein